MSLSSIETRLNALDISIETYRTCVDQVLYDRSFRPSLNQTEEREKLFSTMILHRHSWSLTFGDLREISIIREEEILEPLILGMGNKNGNDSNMAALFSQLIKLTKSGVYQASEKWRILSAKAILHPFFKKLPDDTFHAFINPLLIKKTPEKLLAFTKGGIATKDLRLIKTIFNISHPAISLKEGRQIAKLSAEAEDYAFIVETLRLHPVFNSTTAPSSESLKSSPDSQSLD